MAKFVWILSGLMLCGNMAHASTNVQLAASDVQAPDAEMIASLRARGPDGLQQALAAYDALVKEDEQLQRQLDQLNATGAEGRKESIARVEKAIAANEDQTKAWKAAIDQIGSQRSCAVSRLFWYTDLEAAKAAAKRENKPILSLRMLGKLTDEFSCANSRFFRTALYSNAKVSEFLRVNYILHWQSVRPVPRVTIDFGDGRKLERTITGNSAHYVLSSDGTPLDVLPGLYDPLAFQQWLWDVRNLQLQYDKLSAGERPMKLQQFHEHQRDELLRRWDFDIQRLGDERAELVRTRIVGSLASARLAGQPVPADPAPKAVKAAKVAVGKTQAEAPVLRLARLGGTWMERGMDDELWQAVANLHREDVKLDDVSVAVMRKEFPAAVAMRVAISKGKQEDPVLRMVRAFEDSMTLDTVRNEYLLHRQIHEQFAARTATTGDVDRLNEWVYASLFLTPSSDPWLGLAPRDIYTALDNGGQVEPTVQAASRSGG